MLNSMRLMLTSCDMETLALFEQVFPVSIMTIYYNTTQSHTSVCFVSELLPKASRTSLRDREGECGWGDEERDEKCSGAKTG